MVKIEPSRIKYWRGGKWQTTREVFTSTEEVEEWYKRNRWRIEGLSVVVPLKPPSQPSLDFYLQKIEFEKRKRELEG
jgi:hypothetical protein